jgi:hypothetical protein
MTIRNCDYLPLLDSGFNDRSIRALLAAPGPTTSGPERPGAAGRAVRGSTAGIKRRAVARYDHSRTIGLPTHSGRASALVTTSAVKPAAATVNAAFARPRRERGHSGFQGAPPRTGTPPSWSGKRAMSLASKRSALGKPGSDMQ